MFFDLDGGDRPPTHLLPVLRVNTHSYIVGCVLCVSAVFLVAAAAAAAAACAFEKRSLYCARDESATMFPLRKKKSSSRNSMRYSSHVLTRYFYDTRVRVRATLLVCERVYVLS